jgi:ribosomal protein S13
MFHQSSESNESEPFEISPKNSISIQLLKIKGIDSKLAQEIAESINEALTHLMSNFEELKAGSISRKKLTEELEITLMDYVKYVLANKKS